MKILPMIDDGGLGERWERAKGIIQQLPIVTDGSAILTFHP